MGLNVSNSTNKVTNVTQIVIAGNDSLYFITQNIFMTMPFQTRKIEDFVYFSFCVFMFRFGHVYSHPEGFKFLQEIKNYINKKRYSNADVRTIHPRITLGFINDSISLESTTKEVKKNKKQKLCKVFEFTIIKLKLQVAHLVITLLRKFELIKVQILLLYVDYKIQITNTLAVILLTQ